MKVTMQFSLPDEVEQYRWAYDGERIAVALRAMDSWMRSEVKYGNHSEEATAVYLRCRATLAELVEQQGISIH